MAFEVGILQMTQLSFLIAVLENLDFFFRLIAIHRAVPIRVYRATGLGVVDLGNTGPAKQIIVCFLTGEEEDSRRQYSQNIFHLCRVSKSKIIKNRKKNRFISEQDNREFR